MRSIIADYASLASRVDELEQKYDNRFHHVFEAIRQLMAPRIPPRRAIGFVATRKARRK
jgi:hypothetical protein